MFAATTVSPKRSRMRFCARVIRVAMRRDVLPLHVAVIETLAGVLRAAHYRSADKYLQEAKLAHVEAGHEWTAQLSRCLALAKSSCLRGLGPPRRAAEIRLAVAAAAQRGYAPVTPGGPIAPRTSWLVATFWLLREIELAGLRLHSSHVRLSRGRATLCLPISKTDVGGLGKSRTLKCICHVEALADGRVPGHVVCPACLVAHQVRLVSEFAGVSQECERAREIPLFPTLTLCTPDKGAVVASWQRLVAGGAGPQQPTADIMGHSARRSGAKFFARCGWALWQVQFHGRWGSDAVKAYIEEAFAEIAEEWALDSAAPVNPPPGPEEGSVPPMADEDAAVA